MTNFEGDKYMGDTAEVKLMAHTQLSEEYKEHIQDLNPPLEFTSGEVVALSAIRTCYSHHKPWDIVTDEGNKYFGEKATDGFGGRESDRLFRAISSSGHTSTMEHVSFTFAIHNISRALLAQLTRHRVGMSFSVQSQRYVKLGSENRSGGFDNVMPLSVWHHPEAKQAFEDMMGDIQSWYDLLRQLGVPAEDARAVLPQAASTNLVLTANLTALIAFYSKRRKGNGAQHEIARFAEQIREAVVAVEPWTERFFDGAWHGKNK
jgi:thymidylate synthase (FAD)